MSFTKKQELALKKSLLKRKYEDALNSMSVTEFEANPYVKEAGLRAQAKKALTGKGAYSMYTGSGAYSLGGTIGGFIGKQLGNKKLGRTAGRAIGKYIGSGDYYNQLFPSMSGETAPQFQTASGEDGAMTICHREYVGNIYGDTSADFTNQNWHINPGLERTFPWLSQLAQNYDEYIFHQLVFDYESCVTDQGVASNGQVGTVIIATQYNAGATPFTEVADMMNYTGKQSAKSTENQIHGVECAPEQLPGDGHKYVRAAPVLVNEDIKTYDVGVLNIAQNGMPSAYSNALIGRLYVYYTVTLRKPRFFTGRGLGISKDIFVSSGAVSSAAPLGAVPLKGQQNNIGIAYSIATNVITFTFPATWSGNVKCHAALEGTGILGTGTWAVVAGSKIVNQNDMYASSGGSGLNPTNVSRAFTATDAVYVIHEKVSPAVGSNNQMTYTLPSFTTLTQVYFEFAEYNSSFGVPPVLVNDAGAVVQVP